MGDAHALPFASGSVDCIICRAAFKNFSDPVTALREMRRTLKPDSAALIIDMRNDVSDATIDEFVRSRAAGRANALITGWTFKHMLRKRAYSRSDMLAMATAAATIANSTELVRRRRQSESPEISALFGSKTESPDRRVAASCTRRTVDRMATA